MDILSGRAFVEVSIIEGLKATANWGMDLDNTRYTELINPYYGQYAGNTGGVVGVSHSRVFSINQQYLLTYKKNFGDHNIDLLAGFESYDYKNQALSGSKQKVYNPNIVELNNAINTPSANSSTANYATAGFLSVLSMIIWKNTLPVLPSVVTLLHVFIRTTVGVISGLLVSVG
jgi:hypothetical protein